MSDKIIVCRCEDVTLDELRAALARGYATIEELKRLTGLGTGPCQGKECQAHVAHLLEGAGVAHERIRPFTARPPFAPTPLRLLAGVPPAKRP
jgi:sarcosine oxidase subunit beta